MEDKVFLTPEERDKIRGLDSNDWNPVVYPRSFREVVSDREKWPEIHIKKYTSMTAKEWRVVDTAMKTFNADDVFKAANVIIEKTVNLPDLETGELIEWDESKKEQIIESMPPRWVIEAVSRSRIGGTTEEEIEGVKS